MAFRPAQNQRQTSARFTLWIDAARSYLFKHIFRGAAQRANPVVRQRFKRGIRGNVAIVIAIFWLVDVTADLTFPLVHLNLLYWLGLRMNAPGRSIISISRRRKFFQVSICVSPLAGREKQRVFSNPPPRLPLSNHCRV